MRFPSVLLNPAPVMRRPLIAGNWKMNLNRADSVSLAAAIGQVSADHCDVLICPPGVYLDAVNQATSATSVEVGAQDVYFEANGAFTGETSTSMLQDLGCQSVILGHSERRNVMGESNELINRKVHAALGAGLTVILCLGELLEQREAGQTMAVVREQFEKSLADVTEEQLAKVVIAYEPVWAIGTGVTATPAQAQEVHADLRNLVAQQYNPEAAQQMRILYGGSVKPANAAELLSQPDLDGALVGGASLKADSFAAIIEAAVPAVTR